MQQVIGILVNVQVRVSCNAEQRAGFDLMQLKKAVDAVNDLMNGRVDAVIVDKNPAEVFVSKYPDDVKAIPGAQFEFPTEYYAIACPKGSAIVAEINKALEELKADGTFDTLVAEYIGAE